MKRLPIFLTVCALALVTCVSTVPTARSTPEGGQPTITSKTLESTPYPTNTLESLIQPTSTWEGGRRPPITPENAGQVVLLSMIESGTSLGAMNIAWSPDGEILAVDFDKKNVTLYETETFTVVQTLECYIFGMMRLAFRPDGAMLATTCNTGNHIVVWDMATYESIAIIESPGNGVNEMVFSPDGQKLVVVTSGSYEETSFLMYDVNNLDSSPLPLEYVKDDSGIGKIAFSPDGKRLAIFYFPDWSVKIWDLEKEKVIAASDTAYIYDLVWSPDGNVLAVREESQVELLNPETLESQSTLISPAGNYDSFGDMSFNPTGNLLSVPDATNGTDLWDTAKGEYRKKLQNPRLSDANWAFNNGDAVFNPDGTILATCSDDIGGAVWLWGIGAPMAIPTSLPTATFTPTFTPRPPTPTPIAGLRLYLNENNALTFDPPLSTGESYTECYYDCTLTWTITLTKPLSGNAYGFQLAGSSRAQAFRIVYIHNERRTILAEWLAGDREAKSGPTLNAQPGDIIQFEVDLSAGGRIWLWDGSDKSFIIIGTLP